MLNACARVNSTQLHGFETMEVWAKGAGVRRSGAREQSSRGMQKRVQQFSENINKINDIKLATRLQVNIMATMRRARIGSVSDEQNQQPDINWN